jgi:hypothetical protein
MHTVPLKRVTDHLFVAVSNVPDVRSSTLSTIKTGHLFCSDNSPSQEGVYDCAKVREWCQIMRNNHVTSFASFVLSSGMRSEDRGALESLSRSVDYIVLDARSLIFSDWSSYISWMRRISRRIGLCVQVSDGMPHDIFAAWVAKAVLEIGSKGIVFIDGPPSLFFEVQNQLEGHKYGSGGGYLIPILTKARLLDLEAVAIECGRTWCAGLCVPAGAVDGRFDIASCLQEMIGNRKSLRSVLHTFGERWPDLAERCLSFERALEADGSISAQKNRLEESLNSIEMRLIGTQGEDANLQSVRDLLAKAPSEVIRRWC